ncbi:hypothetical protein [Streptomyces narbonensis]|uniref:hypothetical protein n=1 Tax=Streptomyces narbonensis TaxID=67333 RepID=UPI0033CBF905
MFRRVEAIHKIGAVELEVGEGFHNVTVEMTNGFGFKRLFRISENQASWLSVRISDALLRRDKATRKERWLASFRAGGKPAHVPEESAKLSPENDPLIQLGRAGMAKLDIQDVKAILQAEDRSVTIHAVCAVRGEVAIKFSESDARWLRADLTDKVRAWNQADGEETTF